MRTRCWIISALTVLFLGGLHAADGPAEGSSPLHRAARAGDLAAAQVLLVGGSNVEVRDDRGDTPLLIAVLHGDVAMLELFLKAGAAVNATNRAGVSPLLRAATVEPKAALLIAAGADPNVRSTLGNSALILASRRPGNAVTVQRLIEKGADVNAANVYGATALMAAAAAGDMETVRLLLEAGADINARPAMTTDGFIWGGGRTPLMWAAFLGNTPMVRLLLERGANVRGFTPVGSALTQAAWGGWVEVAGVLIEAGAPVDHRDFIANYTPLHWAASSEHASPALAGLLLAHGADPSAEGGQPVDNFLGETFTPLSLALKRGDTPIARALRQAGAREPASAPPKSRPARSREPVAADTAAVGRAVQLAIPPLMTTADLSASAFRRHASRQACISCHQQQLPLAAIGLAESRGFKIDPAFKERQLKLLKDMFADPEPSLQSTFNPEPAIFSGYTSMAYELGGHPVPDHLAPMALELAATQHPDGHWFWNIPRPPIQASDLGATALALHTLQYVGPTGSRENHEIVLRKGREWLARSRAETNEERVHQLLGLAWTDEKPSVLDALGQSLLGEQRPDGGWSQLAGLPSDAYATGQSLVALLSAARMSRNHPAIRRGVEFLLADQDADGTWAVRRRAHPFQPPMGSGFPHGADSWISAAGSSWAVLALVLTLDPGSNHGTERLLAANAPPGLADAAPAISGPKPGNPVEFSRDIQPLLERSCVSCHSGDRPKGGYQIVRRDLFLQGGARGEPAVVAGHSAQSPLVRFVADQVADQEMPPLGKRDKFPGLTPRELALLVAWVDQGAVWPEGVILRSSGDAPSGPGRAR